MLDNDPQWITLLRFQDAQRLAAEIAPTFEKYQSDIRAHGSLLNRLDINQAHIERAITIWNEKPDSGCKLDARTLTESILWSRREKYDAPLAEKIQRILNECILWPPTVVAHVFLYPTIKPRPRFAHQTEALAAVTAACETTNLIVNNFANFDGIQQVVSKLDETWGPLRRRPDGRESYLVSIVSMGHRWHHVGLDGRPLCGLPESQGKLTDIVSLEYATRIYGRTQCRDCSGPPPDRVMLDVNKPWCSRCLHPLSTLSAQSLAPKIKLGALVAPNDPETFGWIDDVYLCHRCQRTTWKFRTEY